jgi:hypothetical protein
VDAAVAGARAAAGRRLVGRDVGGAEESERHAGHGGEVSVAVGFARAWR